VSVGKDKGPTLELVEEYARRLQRSAELELFELKASAEIPARVRGELWALDQRGVELTSEQLAAKLSAQMTFCIGGDEGLTDQIRSSARFVWSLSRLTLPHRLARVVVLEQLYRAFEIQRGGPYHK
jgi:23S rRNA (pseudouridine1915-N3)-methyltransferase